MILVSFCRILNGFSDEINLFWRCSFPLSYDLPLPWIRGSPTEKADGFFDLGRPGLVLNL